MNSRSKRILSMIAIIIASVAFGVIISADLGVMRKSNAQSSPIQTSSGAVTSVTIPSFADIASRVAPAVVSITSTEVVKTSDLRRRANAIGHPRQFQSQQYVRGISPKRAAHRLSEQTRSLDTFIQSDASPNFRNPPGPLMTINGELVGLNTPSRHRGAQRIRYTTPI